MKLEVGALTNKGKVRAANEDNFCMNGWHLPQKHGTMENVLLKSYDTGEFTHFGVFDGMGGYTAGDRSSYLAAVMEEAIPKLQYRPEPSQMFSVICREANLRICSEIELIQGQTGSTAAMLGFEEEKLYLCNVGDSPIFRLRDGEFLQMSVEHSERSTFEKTTGKKTDYHQKFPLNQNLGISPSEFLIQPYESTNTVRPGDRYLICSDGITDMVSPERIRQILDRGENIEKILRTLEHDALQAGGKDNLTMILIDAVKSEKAKASPNAEQPLEELQDKAAQMVRSLKQMFHR